MGKEADLELYRASAIQVLGYIGRWHYRAGTEAAPI